MVESKKLEFANLPDSVKLEEAIGLNKEIWRRRDRFMSVSSSLEVPEKFTNPVFDKVIDKFGDYIEETHLTNKPIVGYSVLPDLPLSWGVGLYFPDIGKFQSMKIFEEFGVEWLTRVVYGQNPFTTNCYLGKLMSRVENSDLSSPEDRFLSGLLTSIRNKSLSKHQVTYMFVRTFLQGDLDFFKKVSVEFEGIKENYGRIMKKLSNGKDITQALQGFSTKSVFQKAVLKPIAFAGVSAAQLYLAINATAGNTGVPGIINLSGFSFEKELHLAHEYIHSLSFHRKSWHATPIKGYKLLGGVVNLGENE